VSISKQTLPHRHCPAEIPTALAAFAIFAFVSIVIARSECDEAIHSSFVALWIASLRSQ
jgi:hypothetical protein